MNLRFESPYEQSEPATQGIRAEIGEAIAAEQFSFDNIQPASTLVPPDTDFDVSISYSSNGGFGQVFDPDHPDFCTVGLIQRPGARLFVRLKSGGGVQTETPVNCWSVGSTTTISDTLSAASRSTSGDQTITAELVGADTLTVYDAIQTTISVEGDVDDPPDLPDGGDDDGDQDEPAGGGIFDFLFGDDFSNIGVGFAGGLVFLVILLVLLIAVGGE
jgi:hypothetical protein